MIRLSSFRPILRASLSFAGLWALLGACGDPGAGGEAGPESAGTSARRPVIVVPVLPLAGIVDAVAPSDAVDVVVLVPPGANPATHEPSLREMRRAAGARLYLELGHPSFVFERTWLAGLLEGADAERVAVFDDCPQVEEDYHVWLSVACLDVAARRTAEALIRLLPERSEEIRAKLGAFERELASADSTAAARLAPHRGREFLVLHPAWGYLARPHGLAQLSILAHGTGDPGPARLAELIERARREDVGTILVQPQFNQAPARLVAEELGAEVVTLDPLTRDPIAAIDAASAALERVFAPVAP